MARQALYTVEVVHTIGFEVDIQATSKGEAKGLAEDYVLSIMTKPQTPFTIKHTGVEATHAERIEG